MCNQPIKTSCVFVCSVWTNVNFFNATLIFKSKALCPYFKYMSSIQSPVIDFDSLRVHCLAVGRIFIFFFSFATQSLY